MSTVHPRPRWSTQTKLTISLLLLGFAVYLLVQFRQVIPPLILAVILAYILSPLARRFQKLGLPWVLSIFLSYLVFVAIAIALPAVLIPYLTAQFGSLQIDFNLLVGLIEDRLQSQLQFAGLVIHPVQVLEEAVGTLQQFLQPVIGQSINFAMQIASSLVWLVFILVVSFYLVKDAAALRRWLEHLIPPEYQADYHLLRTEINEIWSSFFRGQLVLALVVSLIFTVVTLSIGLPFALAMSILAGLLEFIPSIGHAIWLTLAVISSLLLGSTWLPMPNWAFALLVVGLHIVFQQFDINYLIPRIIGRRVHLPPLVVILGIVAAAVSVGILGILLAAPTIASARVLGRYVYCLLFDLDPFELVENTATPLPPPDPRWWRRLDPRSHTREELEG